MRGDCDSQLAQCAVRRQAPSLQRARVHATTVAVSDAGDGGSATTTRSEGRAAATKEAESAVESPTRGVRNWCCGRCGCAGADSGGVAVAVADELVLQMLPRGVSEAKARTCDRSWRCDGDAADGDSNGVAWDGTACGSVRSVVATLRVRARAEHLGLMPCAMRCDRG